MIGEYYKEMVLSLPKNSLKKIELLDPPDDIRIEEDLFGWKLSYTKSGRKKEYFMECRSKDEAFYLKILFDLGMREVYIPKNEEYLKGILPELERLKARTDEVLDSYARGLLDPKLRERLKSAVYMEVANVDLPSD
ncbi:MAG: hypothetical protein AB1595_01585 [bacterium]